MVHLLGRGRRHGNRTHGSTWSSRRRWLSIEHWEHIFNESTQSPNTVAPSTETAGTTTNTVAPSTQRLPIELVVLTWATPNAAIARGVLRLLFVCHW